MNTPEMSVSELQQELAGPRAPIVLDVREAEEREQALLEPSQWIPLGSLPHRIGELDPSASFAVLCRSGKRSAIATRFMQEAGIERVRNVQGGLLAWAKEIDPSMQID